MTNEKMTIHKALAELKVIDSRISNAINSTTFVVANKHSNDKINGKTIPDFKDGMKSQNQSVMALIERRNALKRAVVLSNAQTKVTVGGVEYTVAEAIDMKNHGMDAFKAVHRAMTNQYNNALRKIEENSGEFIGKKAEQYIISVINAQPKDSKMSVDSDAIKKLRDDYIASNTYDLIDPNGIATKIQEMNDKIINFETEVDAALSVSNATTTIEFSY